MKSTLFALFFVPFFTFSQSDVSIDHLVIFVDPVTTFTSDSLEVPDTTAEIKVFFRIENISNAKDIYINIGSTDGGSQSRSLTYRVVNNNGSYLLQLGNTFIPVVDGYASIPFVINSEQLVQWRYYEVWGTDLTDRSSSTKKYKL